MKVFIYVDAEHNKLEVFKSLKQAKAHADKCWPGSQDPWEKVKDRYYREPYQYIYLRTIDG